jgi:Mrp family chromosome partitioning ATPase
VQTEVVLATTGPILREVATRHPGVKADDLASSVTVTSKTNALVFEIDVQNSSPTQAAALANDIAQTLIKQQTTLQKKSVRNDKVPPAQFLFLAQPAQVPVGYIQPNTKLDGELGLAAGLLLGILLAMLFERVDTRVRTVEALRREIPWGILSSLQPMRRMGHLIVPEQQGAHLESYNTLLARMAFLAVKDPQRFILVTSPHERDGKTTVAANLAVSMAKAGKRTLLIDANLRDPGLYARFDLPVEKAGLTNALLAFAQHLPLTRGNAQKFTTDQLAAVRVSLDPYIHTIGIPNLRVMPSGPLPPNPAELLSSTAMDLLYRALLRSDAEVIIFDAYSLLGLSDTHTLLTRVDSMLLVIDIMRADKRDLAEVKTLLAQVDVRVLGCVVNRLKRQRGASKQDRSAESRRRKAQQISRAPAPMKQLDPLAAVVSTDPSIPAKQPEPVVTATSTTLPVATKQPEPVAPVVSIVPETSLEEEPAEAN